MVVLPRVSRTSRTVRNSIREINKMIGHLMHRSIPILLSVLAALAGCGVGGTNDVIGITGQLNSSDNGFSLDGTVENSGFDNDPPTYHNVTVYLFTSNGTIITAKSVGDLRYSTGVQINTTSVPQYVIPYSSDFWSHGDLALDYYSLSKSGQYVQETATEMQDLPTNISFGTNNGRLLRGNGNERSIPNQ